MKTETYQFQFFLNLSSCQYRTGDRLDIDIGIDSHGSLAAGSPYYRPQVWNDRS
jgi:hypothetical protein